jgi:hypothetical protein
LACHRRRTNVLVSTEKKYDSVVDDAGRLFREFVVYDGSQCYPEYLITYRRVAEKAAAARIHTQPNAAYTGR